jgi:putative oxidoreductase
MTPRQRQTIAVLVSLGFLVTGTLKLIHFSLAVHNFTTWGVPFWMMHFIGTCELAGAIGLLLARTRLAAAYALFVLMFGGLVTHLTFGEYAFALMPIAYGTGLFFVMKDVLPAILSAPVPSHGTM